MKQVLLAVLTLACLLVGSGPAGAAGWLACGGAAGVGAWCVGQPAAVAVNTAAVAAVPPRDSSDTVVLTAADNGKTLTARPGKLVLIRLPGNPATGFVWEVGRVTGDAVRARGETEYETPPPSVPTAIGTFVLKFRTTKAGKESTIRLVYIRPDERDRPPAKMFTASVKVR